MKLKKEEIGLVVALIFFLSVMAYVFTWAYNEITLQDEMLDILMDFDKPVILKDEGDLKQQVGVLSSCQYAP